MARERAARARARGGADDPGERSGRGPALGAPARDALPRPRAPGPAGDRPSPRAPRRPRGADAAGPRGRPPDAVTGRRARGCGERGRDGVRPGRGPGTRRLPAARAPLLEAGALPPGEPRPLRPREPRLLPLHLADPPLPGPRLPPRAPSGARRLRRSGAGRPGRARGAHVVPGARRRSGRVPRRRALPRLAARERALPTWLGRALRGRDRRTDRIGALRPLRRRLRGLPTGPPPPRRLLRAE